MKKMLYPARAYIRKDIRMRIGHLFLFCFYEAATRRAWQQPYLYIRRNDKRATVTVIFSLFEIISSVVPVPPLREEEVYQF